MRQVWAILLVCLFSLELIGPALLSSPEAELPACCRRDGKHGCGRKGMSNAQPSTDLSLRAVASLCPLYPKGSIVPASGNDGVPAPGSALFFADVVRYPARHAQTEARFRLSFSRASQKRGPPVFLS